MASADIAGAEWGTFEGALALMRDMKIDASYLEVMVPLDNLEKLFNEEKRRSTSDIEDIQDEVNAKVSISDMTKYAFRIKELLESIFVTKLYDQDGNDAATTVKRIIQVDRINTALNRFFMSYVEYGFKNLNVRDEEKFQEQSLELQNLFVDADDIHVLLLSFQLKYLSRHDTETLLTSSEGLKGTEELTKVLSELKNRRLVPKENVIDDFESKEAGRRIWEKIHMVKASGIIVLDSKDNLNCPRCQAIISEEMEYAILDSCNDYFCAECARQQFTAMSGLCPRCDKLVRFWVSKKTFQEYVQRVHLVYPEHYIPKSLSDW